MATGAEAWFGALTTSEPAPMLPTVRTITATAIPESAVR
jgi:hypothetical protein